MAQRCKAKAKTTGDQCRQPVVRGMEVCRFHGGKSLRGVASPAFRHGRRSAYIPDQLTASYRESLQDPDVVAVSDELALIDARINELLLRLRQDGGEPKASTMRLASEHYADLMAGMRTEDEDAIQEALTGLGRALRRGVDETVAWSGILELVDQRRKLAEAERKRVIESEQVISIERMMVLVAAVIDVIRQHVKERSILNAIAGDLRGLVDVSPRGG